MRVVLLAVLLAGCASSESEDECARVRVDCPNEPSLVEECRTVAPTCPATARALFLCIAHHQVCDGRGKLDRAASTLLCLEQRGADELCNGRTDSGAPDSSADSSVDSGTVDSSSDASEETAPDAKPD